MPIGPGRYDDELTELREKIGAEGAILIVYNGQRGSGFSAQWHRSTRVLPCSCHLCSRISICHLLWYLGCKD